MPKETHKIPKSGLMLLRALEKEHQANITAALDAIGEEMGIDMSKRWDVNLQLGQFETDVPPSTPQRVPASTVALPMPVREIPFPAPVAPTSFDENGVKTDAPSA